MCPETLDSLGMFYSCVFQSSGSVESSPSSSPGSQAAPAPTTITIPNGAPKFGTLVPNR